MPFGLTPGRECHERKPFHKMRSAAAIWSFSRASGRARDRRADSLDATGAPRSLDRFKALRQLIGGPSSISRETLFNARVAGREDWQPQFNSRETLTFRVATGGGLTLPQCGKFCP